LNELIFKRDQVKSLPGVEGLGANAVRNASRDFTLNSIRPREADDVAASESEKACRSPSVMCASGLSSQTGGTEARRSVSGCRILGAPVDPQPQSCDEDVMPTRSDAILIKNTSIVNSAFFLELRRP
jgi:hypothetical protein